MSFAVVAVVAGVNKVSIFPAQIGGNALGALIIGLKSMQLETPLLALQAIDAPEVELVAQPWAKMGIMRLTTARQHHHRLGHGLVSQAAKPRLTSGLMGDLFIGGSRTKSSTKTKPSMI